MVRHLACARDGRTVVAGKVDTSVEVWNVNDERPLARFDTILEFGGSLALRNDGDLLVVGTWNRGVAAYDARNGNLAWQRGDIKEIHDLFLAADDNGIWCVLDRCATLLLDCRSGETLEELPGRSLVVESESGGAKIFCRRQRDVTLEIASKRRTRIERGVLIDAAIGDDSCCLSKMGASVDCVSFDLDEKWRFNPPVESHVISLAYSSVKKRYYGILYKTYRAPDRKMLIEFDPSTGEIQNLGTLTALEQVFSPIAGIMIDSEGIIRELSNASYLGKLNLFA